MSAAGGSRMIGRTMPTSTGAAIRSQTATVTRRPIRSDSTSSRAGLGDRAVVEDAARPPQSLGADDAGREQHET